MLLVRCAVTPLTCGMHPLLRSAAVAGLMLAALVAGEPTYDLTSPDGQLSVRVRLADLPSPRSPGVRPYLSASRAGVLVLADSPLGLTASTGEFGLNASVISRSDTVANDSYTMISGKRSAVTASANQMTLRLQAGSGGQCDLIIRAYNDGIAWRRRLLGSGNASITGEQSAVAIPTGSLGFMAPYGTWHYETKWSQGTVGSQFTDGNQRLLVPALFRVGSTWAWVSEADVDARFPAATLYGSAAGIYPYRLPDASVSGTLPWDTPWRCVAIGSLGSVVETNLVSTLATPSQIADTSWIRPGRSAWSWWSQQFTGDLNVQKTYTDVAQAYGWEYNLVDEGWKQWNGSNPGPHVLDLVAYGNARNVKQWLWLHYNNVDTQAERDFEFSRIASWGVVGVKVDFFDSDAKSMNEIRQAILQSCATYQLMVNFHGDHAPRGWQRTWPNLMTTEGVFGAEWYQFDPAGPGVAHNCMLPFTRNVAGAMDYTPVTFTVPTAKRGTKAHELALAVVFQSGVQHLADSAASYNALGAGRSLLQAVPAGWDEVRFVDGFPGQWAAIARRKGTQWWLGVITDGSGRTVNLPLSFLAGGSHAMQRWDDGAGDSIVEASGTVTAATTLSVTLPAEGGSAFRFTPGGGGNQPPNVSAIAVTPNANGITVGLAATASDDGGEPALGYAWTVVSGPAAVGFSPNSGNAARTTTATFTTLGTYVLRVTATDTGTLTGTRDATVVITAVPSSVTVTPTAPVVLSLGSQGFSATVRNQFAGVIAGAPVTWSVISGGGSVNASGVYTAPIGPVAAQVRATSGTVFGTANPIVSGPGDVNGDRTVNAADLLLVSGAFGTASSDGGFVPAADINRDGVINLTDLGLVTGNYGASY